MNDSNKNIVNKAGVMKSHAAEMQYITPFKPNGDTSRWFYVLYPTSAFINSWMAVNSHPRNVILDFRGDFVPNMTRLRETLHD